MKSKITKLTIFIFCLLMGSLVFAKQAEAASPDITGHIRVKGTNAPITRGVWIKWTDNVNRICGENEDCAPRIRYTQADANGDFSFPSWQNLTQDQRNTLFQQQLDANLDGTTDTQQSTTTDQTQFGCLQNQHNFEVVLPFDDHGYYDPIFSSQGLPYIDVNNSIASQDIGTIYYYPVASGTMSGTTSMQLGQVASYTVNAVTGGDVSESALWIAKYSNGIYSQVSSADISAGTFSSSNYSGNWYKIAGYGGASGSYPGSVQVYTAGTYALHMYVTPAGPNSLNRQCSSNPEVASYPLVGSNYTFYRCSSTGNDRTTLVVAAPTPTPIPPTPTYTPIPTPTRALITGALPTNTPTPTATPITTPIATPTPILSATCSVSPSSTTPGVNITWTAYASGGRPPYTYTYYDKQNPLGSFTPFLSGTTSSTAIKSYSAGSYTGKVDVTDFNGTLNSPICSPNLSVASPYLQTTGGDVHSNQ